MTGQQEKGLTRYINQSMNANTMILSFDRGSQKDFILKDFLLKQLQSGRFYYEMQKADLRQGYEWYTEVVFSKSSGDHPIILAKPGNTRNGNENLIIQSISEEHALTLLLNMMTARKNEGGQSLIDIADAEVATKEFLSRNTGDNISFYTVEPNFLYTYNDMLESDYTILGYFEDLGTNLALVKQSDDNVIILLINGY